MLRSRKDIDAVFRDGLEDSSILPPSHVWETIESSMIIKKKQDRTLFMWRGLVAACVILVVVLSIGLLNKTLHNEGVDGFAVKVEDIVEEEISQSVNTSNFDEELLAYNGKSDETILPMVKQNKAVSVGNNIDQPSKSYLIPLETKNDIDIVDSYSINTNIHTNKPKVYYPLYSNVNSKQNSSTKTTFSLGGVVSPAYNSKVVSGSNAGVSQASGATLNESGISSIGGGVQVRIKKGTRWSFETGVLYAQVGQEVTNSSQQFMAESSSFNQSLLNPQQGQLSNSMGTVIATSSGDAALFYDNANAYIEKENVANLAFSDGLKQTLDYLEIPMIARYSLFKSFPYLSVAGGLSSNFLIGNRAYAINGNDKQEIGKTDEIKPFVISSSVGLGLEVPLGETIRFSLEPRLKYFINSVSSSSDVSFRPYSFGVYGGIAFVIK